jgi:hypothetical protein
MVPSAKVKVNDEPGLTQKLFLYSVEVMSMAKAPVAVL